LGREGVPTCLQPPLGHQQDGNKPEQQQDALDEQACAVDGERTLGGDGVSARNGVEPVGKGEADTGDVEDSAKGGDEARDGDDDLKPIAHRSAGECLDQHAEYRDAEDDEHRH